MIGHITTGSSARGIFGYLLDPSKDPKIIGGNTSSESIDHLSLEFLRDAKKNPHVQKNIHHFSIAFAPEDGVVPLSIQEKIFHDVAVGMGYILPDGEQPSLHLKKASSLYLVVAHGRHDKRHDRPHNHDHCHAAFSAVNASGGWVSNSFNYWTLQPILRAQEQKYGLRPVLSSFDQHRRAPTHGQWQRWAREMAEVTALDRNTADPPISSKLQDIILLATIDRPSTSTFIDRLQAKGVSIRTVPIDSPHHPIGISYSFEGVAFQGADLHSSLRKLIGRDRITFDPLRDLPVLQALEGPPSIAPKSSIQSAIVLASTGHPSLSEFSDRLLEHGVTLSISRAVSDHSTIRGISYSYQNQKWSGSQLDATWPQLQALGVDQEPSLSFDVSAVEPPPERHLYLGR
jgi:hypothetical protein